MHFPFSRTCYIYYEEKLAEYIEAIINGVCKNLKRIILPEYGEITLPDHEEVNMGTTLFEVYLLLKKFSQLGKFFSFQRDLSIQQFKFIFLINRFFVMSNCN